MFRCDTVPLTAPTGTTLSISANPTRISAVNGASIITVTAFKSDEADGGGTVPDGTQIFFTTNLGLIDERVETENGVARATLNSNGRSGTATIAASSGGGISAVSTTVNIGTGGDDVLISLIANPATLGVGELTSEIIATLTDADGNFLSNVPVLFSTTAGSMASQGAIIRTNAQGQAFDRLTLRPEDVAGSATGSATLTATSGDVTGTTTVSRTALAPVVVSVSPSQGAPGTSLSVAITGQNFQPGATVFMGDGISITNIDFGNSSTLLASIVIATSASTGTRSVTVTNPDGKTGSASLFNVTTSTTCDFDVGPLNISTPGTGTAANPFLIDSTFCSVAPCTVTFDASSSGGNIASYTWDFGDATTITTVSTPNREHDYATLNKVYLVLLTTTDTSGGTCTTSYWIELP